MKDNISQEQVDFYQDNGYIVIENFLDAKELKLWRRVTDEAVEERMAQALPGDGGMMMAEEAKDSKTLTKEYAKPVADEESYYSGIFKQCVRLADTNEEMHDIMYDERLGRAAGTLAQVDGVRIWHDQALIKPPYGNPTSFHLDNPYWSFSSPGAISIWVALDDATLANGCMWYLPGTHKTASYERSVVGIGANMRDVFKIYPEWKTIEAQNAACPAGSAVFHSGIVAHGAGANMTPRPRRAMTCGYMPDGSTFNGTKNILPQDYFDSLKIGDVLDNDVQNPLIWKK
jgi:phytanoyl-CoA hydroxylase